MSTVRQLVTVVVDSDGSRLEVTTVQGLADLLRGREFGDYDVAGSWALDDTELVPVHPVFGRSDFDLDQYAVARVEVAFPDGGVEHGYYSVDGSA